MNECPPRIVILSEVGIREANANEPKDPFHARSYQWRCKEFSARFWVAQRFSAAELALFKPPALAAGERI
jgi:hypothetical protein